jgi:anti-sigma-K factor RskA
MPETDPLPDDDVLAGELALGVLEGIELAEAQRRQIAEPEFARQVERWRTHFAVLALQTAEREPPAALAGRVAEAVRGQQTGTAVAAISVRRQLRQWRAAAIAGGGIAAALAIALLWPLPPQQPPAASPMLVAALELAETNQTLLASLDAAGQVRVAGQVAVPKARDAQLWLIIGSAPPRSLGLLRVGADQRLVAAGGANASAIVPGSTLAISIEPIGGSPTGLPTGPVIASGVIQKI